ncbi:hypothetical protein KDJ57_gp36 [Gordonia phage Catfish]|uniref:Uncharacterized protein n=1 Tax=Gordonia phage Catfish TaxID=2301538 RepID=A0A385D1I0_9CAUD|nr:hypothetical protein KDJ57_gp36 [Gordonia phage Catfish]AXQ51909.1 hypothetical protein SEA_CATFISH_73 [Gordonia phage Catfish]
MTTVEDLIQRLTALPAAAKNLPVKIDQPYPRDPRDPAVEVDGVEGFGSVVWL